ncbi:MAG: hypothetical protein Q7J68_06340 [Thermoplasmata archaeon]|nr:hypothetical protein [Thermoplasmata archaeon]
MPIHLSPEGLSVLGICAVNRFKVLHSAFYKHLKKMGGVLWAVGRVPEFGNRVSCRFKPTPPSQARFEKDENGNRVTSPDSPNQAHNPGLTAGA